ncbi:MAG: helix-hairpin-helix domain-containing protein [Candidatus Edwardsbacteria bacterium]|nr:helix-hairpin-helix domain-containing protein [Candidatus Edwardsbacteria bacterium]
MKLDYKMMIFILLTGPFLISPAPAQQVDFYQETQVNLLPDDTLAAASGSQLDLNRATREEILGLSGIPPKLAEDIHTYRFERGAFASFYQLMQVPGMTPVELNKLRQQVAVFPSSDTSRVTRYIAELQDRLASEESPGYGAINEWEELLLHPMDINRASIDQLLTLQNVSPIDAAAVARHIRYSGRIKDWRTLQRNIDGLSHYGFTNMRNYVTINPREESFYFDGNYRVRLTSDDRIDPGDEGDFRYQAASLNSALLAFVPGSAIYDTMTTDKILSQHGWTEPEIAQLKSRLQSEYDQLRYARNDLAVQHRLRMDLGGDLKLGYYHQKEPFETEGFTKAYVALYDLAPVDKLFLGNYRLTFGQGLAMDNRWSADESMVRRFSRGAGVFGDITSNEEFALRGAALQSSIWNITPSFFFSSDQKDGILNRDGTVSTYFSPSPRYPWYRDVFNEKTYGMNLNWDLSGTVSLPVGTSLGLTAFECRYDKPFRPDPYELDLPGDKNDLSDPNFTQLWSGNVRGVKSGNFRTVVDNLSVEGELAHLNSGGWAYLWKTHLQYETLYLLLLRRHYDVDYDNPYSRGFSEQTKFDDTILEKEYRLIDPVYKQLVNYPAPKAEDGTYIETRWQISRQFTITRAYIDFWRNLAYGLDNVRFQGELEYRPVFPLRFRLKQKYQTKYLPKSAEATRSNTRETTLRTFCTLTDRDYFNVELRYGEVRLTPSTLYGSNTLMSGVYVASNWQHNFSPNWDLRAGIASWRTDAMSQWIFEDAGIDFLDGDGTKYFISVSDRLSDNLQARLRLRGKDSRYNFNNIYGPDYVYYYTESPAEVVQDFTDRRDLWKVDLQLDFRW